MNSTHGGGHRIERCVGLCDDFDRPRSTVGALASVPIGGRVYHVAAGNAGR